MSGPNESAERADFAGHIASAQRELETECYDGRRTEILFARSADGVLYSFAVDRAGVTIRLSGIREVNSLWVPEVNSLWVPDVLFGPLRRAMVASQELDGGGK